MSLRLSFRRWALRYEHRRLLQRIYLAGRWTPLVRVTPWEGI